MCTIAPQKRSQSVHIVLLRAGQYTSKYEDISIYFTLYIYIVLGDSPQIVKNHPRRVSCTSMVDKLSWIPHSRVGFDEFRNALFSPAALYIATKPTPGRAAKPNRLRKRRRQKFCEICKKLTIFR